MIISTRQGNREVRMFEASALIPPPGSRMQVSGTMLRTQELEVAAVACAVQLVSETMGIPVMRVYEGDAEERRHNLKAPQARLFQEPFEDETSFDLWADTAVSLEIEKAAFLWKTITKQGVEELVPVDPRLFMVTRKQVNGPRIVQCRIDGRLRDVTRNVVYIRSWSPVAGAAEGASKLELHRLPLRTARSLEEYRGRYYENDGTPGVVLDAGGTTPTKVQREELLDSWMNRQAGAENYRKPGLIWGSVKAIHQLAPTLQDAQAAELSEMVALDVARAWRIYPADLLHAAIGRRPLPVSAEVWADIFLRFSMLTRFRRVERAISADRDIFPDRRQYSRFDVDELLRGDITTIASMIHMLVQDGVINPNEGRAKIGLPPRKGGEKYQETPVGGAPNDSSASDNPAGAAG